MAAPRNLGLLLFIAVSACGDPIVGVECDDGYLEWDGRCVPEPEDGGRDAGMDASVPDAARFDGALPDRDGTAVDSSAPDAGPPSCNVGELLCDDACVAVRTDTSNCGDCGVVCATAELCVRGACLPGCDPPNMMCGALCLDTTSDPNNCGRCGGRCASGICVDSFCEAPTAGHLVVIGHDYKMSRSGMNRIAGNAVFLSSGADVDVLVFEGAVDALSAAGVRRAINQVATARGSGWNPIAAESGKVSLQLADADVFLIHAQHGSDNRTLRDLGARWAIALDTFVRRGGVVVLFDGDSANDGTWQILLAAALFTAEERVDVSGDNVSVVAPGDAVAVRVPLVYLGETSTVVFKTSEPSAVVEHAEGPVVVHRVFSP